MGFYHQVTLSGESSNFIEGLKELKKYSKGIYVFRVSYGDKTEEVRVLRD